MKQRARVTASALRAADSGDFVFRADFQLRGFRQGLWSRPTPRRAPRALLHSVGRECRRHVVRVGDQLSLRSCVSARFRSGRTRLWTARRRFQKGHLSRQQRKVLNECLNYFAMKQVIRSAWSGDILGNEMRALIGVSMGPG
ncbi:hypothetical protein BYI23_A013090 [Burkholderia sp. YI23]|nr:hypothetical protein BYI23_A013090 [Burkholderia sp. YI23]